MRISDVGFHALLVAALFIGPLSTLTPVAAAVYSPQRALPPPAIQDFLADPSALLKEYPDGGAQMISRVRDLAASDPMTLNAIVGLLATANPNQSTAIGTGLGQVALMAVKSDQAYANQIQEAIARSAKATAVGGGAGNKIGGAVKAIDEVEGTTDKGTEPIAEGSDVFLNEVVRTGASGKAELLFADRTNLTVGPVTTIQLDKFVYDPNGGSGKVVLVVSRGAFRFITGVMPSRNYEIRTPVTTLGIRGTEFIVLVGSDGEKIQLVKGQVMVRTLSGQTVDLNQPCKVLLVDPQGHATDGGCISEPLMSFAALGRPTTNTALADAATAFSAVTGTAATGAGGRAGRDRRRRGWRRRDRRRRDRRRRWGCRRLEYFRRWWWWVNAALEHLRDKCADQFVHAKFQLTNHPSDDYEHTNDYDHYSKLEPALENCNYIVLRRPQMALMNVVWYLGLRLVLVGFGGVALVWGGYNLPLFSRQASIEHIAAHVIARNSYKSEVLDTLVPQIEIIEGAMPCRPSAVVAAATVRTRLAEQALDEGDDIDLRFAALHSAIVRSLSCTPANPFLWTVLYWLENNRNGFRPDYIRYLALSYEWGPNEGWVALQRNALALAIFGQLPPVVAEKAVAEFARILDSGLTAEAVANFTGPGWPERNLLLLSLKDVAEPYRVDFAKALYRAGYDIAVPGVERPDPRPWH